MENIHLDVRGLSCPEPVWKTVQALEEVGERTVEVLVDTQTQVGNITRAVERKGFTVEVSDGEGGCFVLRISRKQP